MSPPQQAKKTVSRKINSSVVGEVAKENFFSFLDFFKRQKSGYPCLSLSAELNKETIWPPKIYQLLLIIYNPSKLIDNALFHSISVFFWQLSKMIDDISYHSLLSCGVFRDLILGLINVPTSLGNPMLSYHVAVCTRQFIIQSHIQVSLCMTFSFYIIKCSSKVFKFVQIFL